MTIHRLHACPHPDRLRELVCDTLSDSEREELEDHLTTCDECREWFVQDFEADLRWHKWDPFFRSLEAGGASLTRWTSEDSTDGGLTGPTSWDFIESARPHLPGYEIIKEIGRGGMGVVYLARDVRLKRYVAIKLLLAGALAGPGRSQRFHHEAVVVARLDHPYIVRIHEVGKATGAPFLSLEYVEGPTLGRWANTTFPSPREIAQLMQLVADGVHYAHEQGVIHRDLKPSNILVTGSAEGACELAPKITDFGLAKLVDDQDLTRTGEILGTPSYMAPELLSGSEEHRRAAATDIYALGAILYELLVGRPPFRGNNKWETLVKLGSTDPISPRVIDPTIPRDLETICLRCIHPLPSHRYASAHELSQDLHRFHSGRPVHARPVSPWEKAWKYARRHPRGVTIAASLVLCLLVLVGLWIRFTKSLHDARIEAVAHAERAEFHLDQAQSAARHYLEQVSSDQRLGAQGLESLRRSLIEEALVVYEKIATDDADDELVVDHARAHYQLGTIQRATAPKEAEARFRKTIQLLETPISKGTTLIGAYRCSVSSYISIANLAKADGRVAEALTCLQEAEALLQVLLKKSPHNEMHHWQLAALSNAQGDAFEKLGRRDQAEDCYRRAIDGCNRLPAISDFQLERSKSHANLARVIKSGDQNVLDEFQSSLRIARNVVRNAHPVLARYRDNLTQRCLDVIEALAPSEAVPQVTQLYDEAIFQQQRLIRDYPEQAEAFQTRLDEVVSRAVAYHQSASQLGKAKAIHESAASVPARPRSLTDINVLLNEGYRALQGTHENEKAERAFQSAIQQLTAGAFDGLDAAEAREYLCIAQARLALICWRRNACKQGLERIDAALQLASERYVQPSRLQLLRALLAAGCGQPRLAEQALESAVNVPDEMLVCRAQALLLCAAACIRESSRDARKSRSFLSRIDELRRATEASSVSRSKVGRFQQAIYHALWVRSAEQLASVTNENVNAIRERHRHLGVELLKNLCGDSSESRDFFLAATRAHHQLDPLRRSFQDALAVP